MPICPELSSQLFAKPEIGVGEQVELNLSGFTYQVEYADLLEMTRRMFEGISWVPVEKEDVLNRSLRGRLTVSVPSRRDLRNLMIKGLMNNQDVQEVMGITSLDINLVPHDYSHDAHKKQYGKEHERYYFDWSKDYATDNSFYQVDMTCCSDGGERELRFVRFPVGDDKLRAYREENLFLALYTMASMPDMVWKSINEVRVACVVGRWVLFSKDNRYLIEEADQRRFRRVEKDIEVSLREISMWDIYQDRMS